MKVIKKTVKEEVQSSKYQLVSVFQDQMTKFMKHVANIQHQFKVTSNIKNKLADDEVLVHIDFSENYSCKYSEEVQSVHFGGSRNQVTLHTAVIYYKNRSNIVNRSFCTFSESPRHDALAICAHLQPVIAEIKLLVPNIRIIHFQSDGPSTQYRNKKMFYLAATFLIQKLQVKNLHWHFSEKGHGKGAPDGVGGCVKRLADGLVAQGVDIPNLQTLVHELRKTVTNISIFEVDENKIKDIEIHLPKNIHTFKGTLKIHEITWSSEKKEVIQARRLSCQQCSANQSCKHYGIGQIPINSILQRNSDAYSSNNNEFAPITSNTTSVLKKTAEAHDYVILKCYGKKTIQHYVGFIQSYSATENEYKVRFLKRTGTFQFVFPEKDTLYDVEPGDICTTLNQPTLNHRNQYTFDFNFSNYKNLF